jgi:hypothetical protein
MHVLEGDRAERRHGIGTGLAGATMRGFGVEDLDQPLGRAGDGLQRAEDLRDRLPAHWSPSARRS